MVDSEEEQLVGATATANLCNISANSHRADINTSTTLDDETKGDGQKDIEFLKSAVVNEENMAEIKRRLKNTTKYRHEMMKTPEMDFLENFPYFFTDPKLVNDKKNIT